MVLSFPESSPEKNLFLEERLTSLYRSDRLIVRFWVNSPCLILGRFQREEFEVSSTAIREMLPILRRKSGGGTVYHDLGNLNISILASKSTLRDLHPKGGSYALSWFLAEILRDLGFPIIHNENRHALFIGEQKVMGSAAAIRGEMYHFHCSLLVNTDLSNLKKMILSEPNYPDGDKRFVPSVRSPVMNLSDYAPNIQMETIEQHLIEKLRTTLSLKTESNLPTWNEIINFDLQMRNEHTY